MPKQTLRDSVLIRWLEKAAYHVFHSGNVTGIAASHPPRVFVYIYAGRNRIEPGEKARIAERFSIDVDALPRGVLVGTVKIVGCRPLEMSDSEAAGFEIDQADGFFAWLLERPEHADHAPVMA